MFHKNRPHNVTVVSSIVNKFVIALSMLSFFLLIGCQKKENTIVPFREVIQKIKPSNLKVFVIGIDGATYRILDPMIENEELPQIAELIKGGAKGILKSDNPMDSPSLWTSIATGRDRNDHGIKHFYSERSTDRKVSALWNWTGLFNKKSRSVLVNSTDRKVSALWNWMGLFNKTTGFIGWWATWPAEPVNGWMVTDRITKTRWSEWMDGPKPNRHTFPPDLMDSIRTYIVDPMKPPIEEIHQLVPLTPDEEKELLAAQKPIRRHGLSVFKFSYCTQRSFENVALYLLEQGQPDLTSLFLIANDPICHTFWHFYQPEKFKNVNLNKAERLGKLIPNFYKHNDKYIETLLEKVDVNTVVMIVSDHGFEPSGIIPEHVSKEKFEQLQKEAIKDGTVAIGKSGKHHIDGVFIAYGPCIRKGIKFKAHIYDLAPTIMAVLGLPISEDMDGRVVTEIIEPSFLQKHPIQTISSYDDYITLIKQKVSKEVDQKDMIDYLRSLGYIK
jgi:predicted AlkP superfamily pyrophosphatase or phosphodiesterase